MMKILLKSINRKFTWVLSLFFIVAFSEANTLVARAFSKPSVVASL